MSQLRIAEIFTSIQGEGIWVGTPSTFVRVSGCNLRCVWCDTPYASWHPEGLVMPLSDILDQVGKAGVRHVVLTGGEPMLFEPLESLTARLRERGHVITIESAGTVFREVSCDLMSLSPKLANSTPGEDAGPGWTTRHEATRRDRKPLRQLLRRYSCQLKFVVNPEGPGDDLGEIDALLAEVNPTPATPILLMAEGTDPETLHRRERLLAPLAIARNWRLSPRLHVDLYGNTKGT